AAGFTCPEEALREAERAGRRELDRAIIARWSQGAVPRTGWVEERVWRAYWSGALAAAGAPPRRLDELTGLVLEVTRPASSWTRMEPSTPRLLEQLAGLGLRLGVFSNSSGTLEAHLRHL